MILFNSCKTIFRRVAQFGRALRSGRRGRKFESCHADDFDYALFLECVVFFCAFLHYENVIILFDISSIKW